MFTLLELVPLLHFNCVKFSVARRDTVEQKQAFFSLKILDNCGKRPEFNAWQKIASSLPFKFIFFVVSVITEYLSGD